MDVSEQKSATEEESGEAEREESRGEARSGQRPRKGLVTGRSVKQETARLASPPYSTSPHRTEGCTPAGSDTKQQGAAGRAARANGPK